MNRTEKVHILLNSMKSTLLLAADFFYIAAFCLLTAYEFFSTVELWDDQKAVWRELESGRADWVIILLLIVIFQYLCSQDYNWKEYLLAVGIVALGFRACAGSYTFLIYILLLVGARRFSFKKLMWIYFSITFGLTMFTVIGSYVGWVELLIFKAREGRVSLGFVFPTDGAAHFLFLAMTYWYVRGKKMHCLETGIFAIFAYITGMYCKARFSTGLLLSIMVMAIIYSVAKEIYGEEKCDQFMEKSFSNFLVTTPLLANLLIHVLSFLYTEKWSWIVGFDEFVSNRLSLVKIALDVYGIELWGNNISMNGYGGQTTLPEEYYYIDSSYLQISLQQGIVLLAVFLMIFTMACLKARRAKEWIPLMICGVIALHGMFEHHAFQLAYNPFLFMAFAELQPVERRKKWNICKLCRLRKSENG